MIKSFASSIVKTTVRATMMTVLLVGCAQNSPNQQATTDSELIRQTVRPQLRALNSCYEQTLAQSRFSGRVIASFTVETSGQVSHITTTGAENSPAVATCVTQTVQRLSFPTREASLQVTYPFSFAPNE